MSQPKASIDTAESWEGFLEITTVIEIARKHFIATQGREPRPDECIFDQEPPADLLPSAVSCCPLLGQGVSE